MSDIDKDMNRILSTYASAVFEKDVETFMHLYDPDVCVFDAWGVWSHDGSDAWRRAVEAWFTSLGTERVKVSFDEVHATTGEDMASVYAIVTYAGQSSEGEPLRQMQNRITWVLRTIDHVPRIIHEHTSAPIGFEDMKAILSRPLPLPPA